MKISRQWLLVIAVIIVSVTHVSTLKATSLIHAKKNANVTTEEPMLEEVTAEDAVQETSTQEEFTDIYGRKYKLTGIPQVDYVYDPNLPHELNGYNLSNYPFMEFVPADSEIDIDCNKMPDGYYASIKWKCQLYHHCLSGFRANFICPNFTSFDQKTFNCLFASSVNCDKSADYFFRNDGIYADPTTKAPPTTTTIATTTTPLPAPARPVRPLRRPLRRRRPQADYYYDDEEGDYSDDYYDDRARRRKQRPRQRRPVYDDDYEDDRVQRRPSTKSRPMNRGRDEDVDEEDDSRRNKNRPKLRTKPSDSRKNNQQYDRDRRPVDERKPINEGRSQSSDRKPFLNEKDRDRTQTSDRKRPITYINDDEDVEEGPSPAKKVSNDRRPVTNERRQPSSNRSRLPSENRRPVVDQESDIEEEEESLDSRRAEKRPQTFENRPKPETTLVVKPTGPGSSVFGQPRAPPIIRRPVPKNERDKYAYKAEKVVVTTPVAAEIEYYDEYEDSPIDSGSSGKQGAKTDDVKQQSASSFQNERRPFEPTARETDEDVDETPRNYQNAQSRNRNTQQDQAEDESDARSERISNSKQPQNIKYESRDTNNRYSPKESVRGSSSPKKIYNERQTFQTSRDFDSREAVNDRNSPSKEYSGKSSAEAVQEPRPIMRVVKRPFLPSRGGSSNLPRGLQPVGFAKITDVIPPTSTMSITMTGAELLERSPPIVRQTTSSYDTGPARSKASIPKYQQAESDFLPISLPAHIPKTSLDDIDESEYDVTLNDALNPTLKPLSSSRGSPIGFSFNNKYDRNRYTTSQFTSPEQNYAPSEFRRTYVRAPVQVSMNTRNAFPYSYSLY